MSKVVEKLPYYPREVLAERGSIFAELYFQDRPEVSGFVVDLPQTRSHEQGVSLSSDGRKAILSISDSTIFPAGGALDNYGLSRVESRYDSEGEVSRLFADPIFYSKLDLYSKDATPVVSFTFEKDQQDAWELCDIEQTYFHCKGKISRAQGGDLNKHPLQHLEDSLETTLSEWIQNQESTHHVGFIRDPRGKIAAHRPLRQWADFKNLQLIVDLYKKQTTESILDDATRRRIQNYVSTPPHIASATKKGHEIPRTDEQEQVDKDPILGLLRIFKARDISKFVLNSTTFSLLCGEVVEGNVDTVRLIGIGTILGTISVEQVDESTSTYRAGGKTITTSDPEEFIITLLQSTHRENARNPLRQLRAMAAEQRFLNDLPELKEKLEIISRANDSLRSRASLSKARQRHR